ncbi:flavodoxin family protein [Methanocella arvoryzae]|uniref:4Fe-4S ferredoxin-domain protein (NADPH-dependent FMN reductase family) n=1 Tax=Methanocella arvoryzae (strain DSM 22066 / NBRC 105507 / MRE50) TaxID=351160 RepID=Q0W3G6_METAR|nr:flavodoxin family protein [Methanocella arvoryzae]CAJ37077.1 4Fe-4S ferredoxin-domain protein (NADPH-dependent FMN reductase family) [Methanocella arvoryzae MRE50]
MKILAIMGSPRKNGNTYRLTRKVEEKMKKLGDVDFEYVYLKDLDLRPCLGCGACFVKGEDHCPHKDDRAMLEEKMHRADGVIFASPVYVFNVSGLMKNFFDRFAYVCHRPRFFKSALVLATAGFELGTGQMLKLFSFMAEVWGFSIADRFAVAASEVPEFGTRAAKADKKVEVAAKKFHSAVTAGRVKPGLVNMAVFLAAQASIRKLSSEYYDYDYWREHGWLEKDTWYYYEPRAGLVKKTAAKLLSRFFSLAAR